MGPGTCLGKTKPILRLRIADWAQTRNGTPSAGRRATGQLYRQSQFGEARLGSGSRLCQTKPNLVKLRHLGDGTWGRLLCETKPIGPEPIMRNKPNSCHYADPEIGVPGRAGRPSPGPRPAGLAPAGRKKAKTWTLAVRYNTPPTLVHDSRSPMEV